MTPIERIVATDAEVKYLRTQVAALQAECDVLRKDAERYRFWRNRYPVTFSPTDMTPEDVDRATDAAIDAARSTGDGCQCHACKNGVLHASDCAVHNGPALPIGLCDCDAAREKGDV